MKAKRISSTKDFNHEWHSIVKETSATGAHVFLLFFGTEKPGTNDSWCPDCVIADPLIRRSIMKQAPENTILLECPVNREEYKGNSSYFYRTHQFVKLERIPTLIHFDPNVDEIFSERLVEEECQNEDNVSAFVRKCIKST